MIARTWRGVVRADDAEAYAEYIRATGIAEYATTPGNRGAHTFSTASTASARRS